MTGLRERAGTRIKRTVNWVIDSLPIYAAIVANQHIARDVKKLGETATIAGTTPGYLAISDITTARMLYEQSLNRKATLDSKAQGHVAYAGTLLALLSISEMLRNATSPESHATTRPPVDVAMTYTFAVAALMAVTAVVEAAYAGRLRRWRFVTADTLERIADDIDRLNGNREDVDRRSADCYFWSAKINDLQSVGLSNLIDDSFKCATIAWAAWLVWFVVGWWWAI